MKLIMGVFIILLLLIMPTCNLHAQAKTQINTKKNRRATWGKKAKAIKAPSGIDEDLPANPKMVSIKNKATKGLIKVHKEQEGFIIFKSKNKRYTVGMNVIFIRPGSDGVEVIAHGKISAQQDNDVYVELKSGSVTKVPYPGDLVSIIAPPWVPGKEKSEEVVAADPFETEPPPLPDYPGFIQLDAGFFTGSLQEGGSPNQANAYKFSNNYDFNYMHFEWYIDFISQVGFEYEHFAGKFPTSTYESTTGDSNTSTTQIILNYRFRKKFNDMFRTTVRVLSLTEEFETFNKDEALISSIYSGTGYGVRFSGEFVSGIWKTEKLYNPFALHRLYLDINYYPSIDAQDTVIRRGNNSEGSTATEFRVGFTALMYLKWIPWFKRWSINSFYGFKSYDLKFSGATVSEDGGVYTIPENANYKENYQYLMVSFGIRFDDFVGIFLKPR